MMIAWGCSSEFDSYLEEQNSWETQTAMTRSVGSECEEVFQSDEFKALSEEYANFASLVRKSLDGISQEEKEELSELFVLYKSDSLRYKTICEHYARTVLFKNHMSQVEQCYVSLLKAKDELLSNDRFKTIMGENEKDITSQLMLNAGQCIPEDASVVPLKTRSESDCLQLCKEQYDSDMRYAYAIMACETAANIGGCLLGLGITVPSAAWLQGFIFAQYELASKKALDDYEISLVGTLN